MCVMFAVITLDSLQILLHYSVFKLLLKGEKIKKWILLFSKDTLNWSTVTVKIFKMLQKVSISTAVILNVIFIKESLKTEPISTKILHSTTFLTLIILRNVLLSRKSAYQNQFWKVMWHWKLYIYIYIYIYIYTHTQYIKSCFYCKKYLTVLLFLLWFWSNKCCLGEHSSDITLLQILH